MQKRSLLRIPDITSSMFFQNNYEERIPSEELMISLEGNSLEVLAGEGGHPVLQTPTLFQSKRERRK